MNRAIRVSRDERVTFAARSPRLVAHVQHLLLRFGVVTSRQVVVGRAGSSVHALRVDPVSALTADHDAMAQLELGTLALAGAVGAGRRLHPTATLAGEHTGRVRGEVLWDEIVAITSDGSAQVYDLTVPQLHNFVAADVFVHNTAFALGLATHIAVESQLPVLFFSLEMGHRELTQRILSAEARVDSTKMRTGRLTEQDWSKIGKAIGRLEAPLYLDDNPNLTVMEIRAKARRLAARHGTLGLVVVDYLQLMSGRTGAENRQVEVSEISRGLKILARELEVPILALSQLSRNLEARADKRPMLADLRESGSIEQDADVVMFIYRDEVYNAESPDRGVAEIIVSKHRSGPIGTKRLVYLGPYTRFDNAARAV
jgi:replicative DNA helicase